MPLTPEERRARNREQCRRYRSKHHAKILAKRREQYRTNPQTAADAAKQRYYRQVRNADAAGYQKPKQCEVCGDDTTRLDFDHCHQRGIFRGWICIHCNVILGHAKDDPNHLRKLIAYLERTKTLTPPQLSLPGL